jgi:hypothetical protein
MRSKPPGVFMTRKRAVLDSTVNVWGMPRGNETNEPVPARDALEWGARTLVEAALRRRERTPKVTERAPVTSRSVDAKKGGTTR